VKNRAKSPEAIFEQNPPKFQMADLERRSRTTLKLRAVGGWHFASGEESFPSFA
jgi:hypothetical protein